MAKLHNQGKTLVRILGLAAGLVVLVVAALILPLEKVLLGLLQWVQSLGPTGAVVLIALYILGCLLFSPVWIITVSAGFLYGLGWGTVIVFVGAITGASAAFLTGRTLARGWISRKISANPTFTKVDQAIGRQGFRLIFFLRLSPLFPFSLMNYALGITKVSFWRYFWATALGMLPGSVMYVYLGTAARSLTAIATGHARVQSPAQNVIFWIGLAATAAAVFMITRIAQKSLKESSEVITP